MLIVKLRVRASTKSGREGFTIVELLIVVVIIAILAAITIVAYNGIQKRAQAAAISTALNQASKKIRMYQVDNGTFPATLANAGISDADVTYQFAGTTNTYCITGTQGSASMYVSDTQPNPIPGGCPGHGQGGVAAVTNIAVNPSFETNISSVGYMGGAGTDSTYIRASDWAASGTYSIKITKTLSAATAKGVRVNSSVAVAAGDVVAWTATVRNNSASSKSFSLYAERSVPTYAGLYGSTCTAVSANATLKLTGQTTITAANEGQVNFGVLPCGTTFQIGESYSADAFMVVKNQALPSSYSDGSSANWVWNGSAHASSSTGPAL